MYESKNQRPDCKGVQTISLEKGHVSRKNTAHIRWKRYEKKWNWLAEFKLKTRLISNPTNTRPKGLNSPSPTHDIGRWKHKRRRDLFFFYMVEANCLITNMNLKKIESNVKKKNLKNDDNWMTKEKFKTKEWQIYI